MSKKSPEVWLASIPAGFYPTFRYPDGSEENKVPCVGELLWYNPSNADARAKQPDIYKASQLRGDLIFGIDSVMPKLPLRAHGEAWHMGWDISTKWAIDASGTCWMDGAHGGAMHIVSQQELLCNFEEEHERNSARTHLGLAQEEPSWMATARAAGWTPPKNK
jgi:hypothetical protein